MLSPSYNMDLFTRFFVNSLQGERNSQIIASEAYVDYSREFTREVISLEGPNFEEDGFLVESEAHGNKFEGMYRPEQQVEIMDKRFEAMLFTGDGEFAGYALRDIKTKKAEYHVPWEFREITGELIFEPMTPDF